MGENGKSPTALPPIPPCQTHPPANQHGSTRMCDAAVRLEERPAAIPGQRRADRVDETDAVDGMGEMDGIKTVANQPPFLVEAEPTPEADAGLLSPVAVFGGSPFLRASARTAMYFAGFLSNSFLHSSLESFTSCPA